ncbi:hypothetical protein QOT17_010855 [Balamuthia mandrillaris]
MLSLCRVFLAQLFPTLGFELLPDNKQTRENKAMATVRWIVTVIAFGIALFDIAAEANETHVWNPIIEPHARFHIVWQLFSNSLISVLALFLLWASRQVRAAILLLLIEPVGFLLAAMTRAHYEGTYFPANVPQYDLSVLGVPVALLVFSSEAFVLVALLLLHGSSQQTTWKRPKDKRI